MVAVFRQAGTVACARERLKMLVKTPNELVMML